MAIDQNPDVALTEQRAATLTEDTASGVSAARGTARETELRPTISSRAGGSFGGLGKFSAPAVSTTVSTNPAKPAPRATFSSLGKFADPVPEVAPEVVPEVSEAAARGVDQAPGQTSQGATTATSYVPEPAAAAVEPAEVSATSLPSRNPTRRAATPERFDRADSDQVKAVMNTLRSLSRMLSAIAYRPGSSATAEEKAATLEVLVEKTRTYSDHVMSVLLRGREGRLPRWIRPALQELAADVLAGQWEEGREAELDPYLRLTESLVEHTADIIGEAMDEFVENVYQFAHTPDVAQARMLVSVNKAAFSLADAFGEAGVAAADAAPLVGRFVKGSLDDVQGSPVYGEVPADLRVAHAQGMLGRLAQLTAAELRAAQRRGEAIASEPVFAMCWEQARQNYRQIESMAVESYRHVPGVPAVPVEREDQRERA